MRIFWTLLLGFVFVLQASAQSGLKQYNKNKVERVQNEIIAHFDSIMRVIDSPKRKRQILDSLLNDEQIQSNYPKVHLHLLLKSAKTWARIEPKLALKELSTALSLARLNGYHEEIPKIFNNRGIMNAKTNDYLSALKDFSKAAEEYQNQNRLLRWAETLVNESTVHRNLSNYHHAILLCQKAVPILDSAKGVVVLSKAYNIIANAYRGLNQFSKALLYHKKSLGLRLRLDNAKSIAGSYNNIGNVFKDLNELDSASKFFKLYLNQGNFLKDSSMIARAKDNIAEVLLKSGDLEQSFKLTKEAIAIREAQNNDHGVVTSLNRLGHLLILRGDISSDFFSVMNQSIRLAKKLGLKKELARGFQLVSDYYWNKKQYRLYKLHRDSFEIITNEVYVSDLSEELAKMEALFQVKNFRQQYSEEKEKNHIQKESNSRQKRYINNLLILVIAILILAFTSYRLYRKTRRSQKTIKLLLEEVKHRTSGNYQTILALVNLGKQDKKNSTRKTLEIIEESVLHMGALHSLLKPNTEGSINLSDYLWEVLNFLCRAYGIDIERNTQINIEVVFCPTRKAIQIANVLVEICTNSFKHAFPNVENPIIKISLKKKETQLVLKVGDNGIGSINRNKNTLGLRLIEQLVKNLDGTIKIIEDVGFFYLIYIPND